MVLGDNEPLQLAGAGGAGEQRDRTERRRLLKAIVVAGLGMVQVMSYALAGYIGAFQDIDAAKRREERLAQVQVLRDAMDDSDVTASEKYRRIMEAYQNEIELGRTTEGYTGNLPSGQRVNFLRIGRTLLFYQSLDGETTGWYNTDSGQFEELGDAYRLPVSDGLAIARNQTAPDLVRLPVPAPKDAQ